MRKKIILLAGILAMLSSCNVVRTTGTVAANTAYSVAAVPVVLPIAAVAAVGSAAEKLKPKENENPEKAIAGLVEKGSYEYTEPKIKEKNGWTTVSGTFKISVNNDDKKELGRDLKNITMRIPCYDKDGNSVGDAVDDIKVLRKNENLRYSATLESQEVNSCKPADARFSIGNTEIEFEN